MIAEMMNRMSIILVCLPENGAPIARSAIAISATSPATNIEMRTSVFGVSAIVKRGIVPTEGDRCFEYRPASQPVSSRDADVSQSPAKEYNRKRP